MLTNIIIAGYPKSGNTWATRLVAEAIGCPVAGSWRRNVVDALEIEGTDRVSECVVYKSHLPVTALKMSADTCKVVHIVRDPRDIVCSGANYFRLASYLASGRSATDKYSAMIDVLINGGPYPYCGRPWGTHTSAFMEAGIFTIRYEDLLSAANHTVERILGYLGIRRDAQSIDAAVKAQSFEVRKLRAHAEGDVRNDRFLRRGQMGSFRQELTTSQLRMIEKAYASEMAKLGYAV